MTTPITKELREHAEENVKALRLAVKQHAFKDIRVAIEMDLKVAEFALAAIDAEPVYQWRERYEEGSLWEDCTKEQYDGFAKDPECEARVLYTAPPTPVCSRPVHPTISSEELDDETLDELIDFRRNTLEYHSQQGNKVQTIIHGVTLTALLELRERRAAMLQAGNSPAIPDGWQLVPVELTPDMRAAWDLAPNTDDDDHNMHVAYQAMLAAVPHR